MVYVTPAQYLEQEETAKFRNEYHDGTVFPMDPGSLRHAIICINVGVALHSDPRTANCYVYGSNGRVRITPAGPYTYADVSVVSGQPECAEESILNPILIIEVLSPSTRDYDCGRKFTLYRAIPSLREYITVAQETPFLEQRTRQDDGSWIFTETKGMESSLSLKSIGCEVPFSSIYSKVEFDA